MESTKEITLTKGLAKAVFDISRGGKLKLLVLTDPKTKTTHTVINDTTTEENFLSGGSYFLYPWVGRLSSREINLSDTRLDIDPPEKDGKGNPLHGFYAKSPRKVIQHAENILELTTDDSYKPFNENFPNFCEKFILMEDRLRVENVFDGDQSKKYPLYFGYGYHPYFGFDGKNIDDLILKTNMHHIIKLDDKTLLPVVKEGAFVYEKLDKHIKNGELLKDTKLDNLFYFDEKIAGLEEPVYQLIDPETKIGIEITSNISNERKNINLVFWQVYTPAGRKSIAIEPMTSPGNAFNINFPNNLVTLKGEDQLCDGNFEIRLINL